MTVSLKEVDEFKEVDELSILLQDAYEIAKRLPADDCRKIALICAVAQAEALATELAIRTRRDDKGPSNANA